MLTFGLLLLSLTHAVEWYSSRNLGDQIKSQLIAKGCFRGSYGLKEDLSLFNCVAEGIDSKPFADLSENARLCVVEMRYRERVLEKINSRTNEVVILHQDQDEVILTNADASVDLYPSLCSSRSEFEGAAWNVIVVPIQPMAPTVDNLETGAGAPNPKIQNLISQTSESNLMSVINRLSSYNTRLSTTTDAVNAVNWAADQYRSYGFSVTLQNFRSGYCPNIVATKPGTSGSVVVIGAHIDSRSTNINNATARAPGADDNGSGMAANLELARLLFTTKLNFQHTIVLAAFCGEEQGLYGSQFMANDYKSKNTNIIGMYNTDMIGYRCGASSTLTFDSRGVDTGLTNTCKAIVPDYLSGFPIGNNSGCCSDNESFQNAGYKTVSFFECPGTTVANPNYHSANDLPSTINSAQLAYFSKAMFACALTQAVPL